MNKKYIYSHKSGQYLLTPNVLLPLQVLLKQKTILKEERLVLHTEELEMIWAPRSTLTTLIPGIPGIKNYQ